MATKRNPKLKQNAVDGFIDANGQFRPIRASKDYNDFRAGDFEPRRRKATYPTLSQFVRKIGGINPNKDKTLQGEVNRLSPKQLGTSGLVTLKSRYSPDGIAERVNEEGFRDKNGDKFTATTVLEAIEDDASKREIYSHPEAFNENPKRRKKSGQLSIFDLPVNAKKTRRVKREDGTAGTVLNEKGDWLSVHYDGYNVPHLSHKSAVKSVNGLLSAAKRRYYVKRAGAAYKRALNAELKQQKYGKRQKKYENKAYAANPLHPAIEAALRVPSALLTAYQLRKERQELKRKHEKARKRKRNPRSINAPVGVRTVYNEFQGRDTTQTRAMEKSHLAPPHIGQSGGLMELWLEDGRKLKFNPKQHVVGADGKRRLWIYGKPIAKPNPELSQNQLELVSPVTHIVYCTKKPHLGDHKLTNYIHEFGEEGGQPPVLAVDRDGYAVLHKGTYRIAREGIRD